MIRVLFLLIFTVPVFAEEVCSKVSCYDKVIKKDGQDFYLVGKTDFTYYLMNIYSVALYTEQENFKGDVLDPNLSKILHFKYHREIERKRLVDGAVDTLKKNKDFEFNVHQKNVDLINSYYQDVFEGDQYFLFYTPEQGLNLEKPGQKFPAINNLEFAKYYLGIWLSKYPLSQRVRDQLLSK